MARTRRKFSPSFFVRAVLPRALAAVLENFSRHSYYIKIETSRCGDEVSDRVVLGCNHHSPCRGVGAARSQRAFQFFLLAFVFEFRISWQPFLFAQLHPFTKKNHHLGDGHDETPASHAMPPRGAFVFNLGAFLSIKFDSRRDVVASYLSVF